MQDNAPPHKSKLFAMSYIKRPRIPTLICPASSHELAFMKNFWDVIDYLLKEMRPKMLTELGRMILMMWTNLDANICKRMVDYMPRHLQHCRLVNSGTMSKYRKTFMPFFLRIFLVDFCNFAQAKCVLFSNKAFLFWTRWGTRRKRRILDFMDFSDSSDFKDYDRILLILKIFGFRISFSFKVITDNRRVWLLYEKTIEIRLDIWINTKCAFSGE